MNGDLRSLRINLGVLNRRCFGCGVGFRGAYSNPTLQVGSKDRVRDGWGTRTPTVM